MEIIEVLEILKREPFAAELAGSIPAEKKRDGGGTEGNLQSFGHDSAIHSAVAVPVEWAGRFQEDGRAGQYPTSTPLPVRGD
jgi:hypothetical protein